MASMSIANAVETTGQARGGRGEVAPRAHARHARAAAHRERGFGDGRGEGRDALGGSGEDHAPPEVVGEDDVRARRKGGGEHQRGQRASGEAHASRYCAATSRRTR